MQGEKGCVKLCRKMSHDCWWELFCELWGNCLARDPAERHKLLNECEQTCATPRDDVQVPNAIRQVFCTLTWTSMHCPELDMKEILKPMFEARVVSVEIDQFVTGVVPPSQDDDGKDPVRSHSGFLSKFRKIAKTKAWTRSDSRPETKATWIGDERSWEIDETDGNRCKTRWTRVESVSNGNWSSRRWRCNWCWHTTGRTCSVLTMLDPVRGQGSTTRGSGLRPWVSVSIGRYQVQARLVHSSWQLSVFTFTKEANSGQSTEAAWWHANWKFGTLRCRKGWRRHHHLSVWKWCWVTSWRTLKISTRV